MVGSLGISSGKNVDDRFCGGRPEDKKTTGEEDTGK